MVDLWQDPACIRVGEDQVIPPTSIYDRILRASEWARTKFHTLPRSTASGLPSPKVLCTPDRVRVFRSEDPATPEGSTSKDGIRR